MYNFIKDGMYKGYELYEAEIDGGFRNILLQFFMESLQLDFEEAVQRTLTFYGILQDRVIFCAIFFVLKLKFYRFVPNLPTAEMTY